MRSAESVATATARNVSGHAFAALAFVSVAALLLAFVDVRRAFLFASYAFRSPWGSLHPGQLVLLLVGAFGLWVAVRSLRSAERLGDAITPRAVRVFAIALLALLIVDLFLYRGVAASRALSAGKISTAWLDAFGATGMLRPPALAASYLLTVWHATMLSILIGALVLASLGRLFAHRFSRGGAVGALVGAVFALPQPFCSCCAAIMAPAYAQRGASLSFLVAFVVGAPMLNLTTLLLAASLLPPSYAALRIGAGLLFAIPLAALVARLAGPTPVAPVASGPFLSFLSRIGGAYCRVFHIDELFAKGPETLSGLLSAWGRLSLRLALLVVPFFLVSALVTAAALQLLPASFGNGPGSVLLSAVTGTLMMVATWTEIPVAQQMIASGLSGPAAAMLITLPPVSLPCLALLAGSIGRLRVVALLGAFVAASGVLAGLLFR